MKTLFLLFSVILLNAAYCQDPRIHEHGFWCGESVCQEHVYDHSLALELSSFFKNNRAQTIVDFGCGTGAYVTTLRAHSFLIDGYDGNPDTPKISGGVAQVLDLSSPVNLNTKFDWVLSLEVGEHLPAHYETTFIENLIRHNKQGIVLSWARKGQGGFGHFNEQENEYIVQRLADYGYSHDIEAENQLRNASTLWWFKNTIMVFRNPNF